MHSLRARLLLAATLTLAVFMVLVGAALDRAFESSAQQSQYERMQAMVYALLGNLEPSEYGDLTISGSRLPDSRLEHPQSGLQAALFSDKTALLWGSPSLDDKVPTPPAEPPGSWRFLEGAQSFTLLFGLRYANEGAVAHNYTLMVSEDATAYHRQIRNYRSTLWGALAAGATVLLLFQGAVLRWSLRPLRRLVRELRAVERGERESIGGEYPDELLPLTLGLNAMIGAERTRQSRYRNALGDLAHSLKTPLAVLQGISERPNGPDASQQIGEQVSRMGHIVAHQLKRAATVGGRTMTEAMPLRPVAEKIAGALTKVYASRGTSFDISIPPDLRLRTDSGDLYELLGNLMDNAAKYGRSRVRVSATRLLASASVVIEDDGAGFPEGAESLLERGVRADTRQEGQGLGLASVKDIVEAYGGTLSLGASEWGGARVAITLNA